MKLFFTLILFLSFHTSFATTYFISPAGSDESGSGSSSNPWRSLLKASSVATAKGDIIHVVAGNYTEVGRTVLAVGVSIEGEGPASVIRAALTQEFAAIIVAISPEGTNGDQHISNIKLDGNKRSTSWAIEIRGRNNFSIHDCVITDFEDRGIVWAGRSDNEDGAPGIYATGNSCYNNTITNCAKYETYGRGCLNIGGQEGMLIYNNTISQTGRAKGTNGWPVKYYNGGFLRGCKIYNNTITKEAFDGMSWDFAIELFNEFGLEIYNNTIIGSIDLNHQNKDSYAYSVYIHDNIIGPASRQENLENGIVLEFETNDVRIENNTLKNLGVIVNFTPRTYDLIRNVTIKNNRCENIGLSDGSHQGFALRVGRDGDNKYSIENLLVLQNQFIASTTARPYWGIGLLGALKINNILVQKNTFANFSAGYLFANPGAVIDTLISDNNVLTANGNNNNPSFTNGGPQHFIARHNTSSGGTVFSLTNIKMNIIRPLYYELKGYDLIEPILLLAVIACFFLSYKENIYVYPIAWICTAIHIFLGLDKELPGEIMIDLCYLTVCIYGWLQWKKRDRKKHRIIRVTASSQQSQLLQVAFFGTCYLLLGITLQYLRSYFAAGRIPWADAFVLASAFTATWLLATKKVEAWYWYIAATAAAIPIYFTEHYLVLSVYCILLLLLSIIGLKKWKKRRQPRKK